VPFRLDDTRWEVWGIHRIFVPQKSMARFSRSSAGYKPRMVKRRGNKSLFASFSSEKEESSFF
jgi:hypothetical protein